MKFTKINTRFVNKIKRYLDEVNIPFMELGQTRNLVVLRASGSYHYLLLHFYDMPDKAMDNFKYFDVKTAYAINSDQLIEAIKRYLDGK
jgi:hypothetical protein